MKRVFNREVYRKLGAPDLGHVMFFKKRDGTKVWGRVRSVEYCGFKGCKGGENIRLGLDPFKKK